MSCNVGEATEGLENELWRRWSDLKLGEWAEFILLAFSHFTYVTAHSTTPPSLYLSRSSLSNPSAASPTSQLILQPFFRFSYVTGFSLTSPGEPPMVNGRVHVFQLGARVPFPARTGILIHILGVCSVLCCLWRWPWHCTDHTIQGGPSPCVSV